MLVGIGVILAVSFGIFFIYRKIDNKDFQIIDAEINKSIAEINLEVKEDELIGDLKPIIKHINREAKKGRRVYMPNDYENSRIKHKYTREILRNFFKEHGYQVEFTYNYFPDSDIDSIKW